MEASLISTSTTQGRGETLKNWRLLTLLTTGHAFEHWYQGVLGPVIPYMTQDLGLTLTQVGLLFTGRAVMSAFSSVGTGVLIDTYGGGKWMLVGCMAFAALFYGGAGFSTSFLTLAPLIWLSGLATHTWHPPAMGLLGMRFASRKGFALGVHGTGANLGQTLAPIIAGFLLLVMSWRGVLLVNTPAPADDGPAPVRLSRTFPAERQARGRRLRRAGGIHERAHQEPGNHGRVRVFGRAHPGPQRDRCVSPHSPGAQIRRRARSAGRRAGDIFRGVYFP